MSKGILKNPSINGDDNNNNDDEEGRKSRKLKWDEEALQAAQAELNALQRCHPASVEPKTPFVHGVRTPSKSPERSSPPRQEERASTTWSTTSEEEEEEECDNAAEIHAEFQEHRKEHYHMGEALKIGRHLIETDEEENK